MPASVEQERPRGGAPVSGRSVSFCVGGIEVGAATTGAGGAVMLVDIDLSIVNAGFLANGVATSVFGDSAHLASASTEELSVEMAAGAVSISNLPATANTGNHVMSVSAVLGDGVPSTTSFTTAICTVSGGVITFAAAGVCGSQATFTEGDNHIAAAGTV